MSNREKTRSLSDDENLGRTLYIGTTRGSVSVGYVCRGPSPGVVPRGTIKEFSSKSRAKLAKYLANADADYGYLGTLTVADDVLDRKQFKTALDGFLCWFLQAQRRLCRSGLAERQSVCWFLEFQQRGAPHIHFFYTHPVPWRLAASRWVDEIDQPWAFETSTKFEELRSGRSGMVAYSMKYALKQDQKTLPEGMKGFGRFWGVRGYRSTVAAVYRTKITGASLPAVVTFMEDLKEAAVRGKIEGDASVTAWAEGKGVVIKTAPGVGDAFLAKSRWRQQAEIAAAKLMLKGFSVREMDDIIPEDA